MMRNYEVRHHFSPGQYIKEMHIPAGYEVGKHKHSFSHFSVLAQGKVYLTVDGVQQVHTAPAVLTIEAGCEHIIHAISDTVWLCTHALSESEFNTDPEKIDAILIAKGT